MADEIYTIGHSNRTFEEFVRLLKRYKIELLIDIRRYPSSRFRWFCRDYLEAVEGFYMFVYVLRDALRLYFCLGYCLVQMCRRHGSAVNASPMTDETRLTGEEKDEPMTKTYKEANPTYRSIISAIKFLVH